LFSGTSCGLFVPEQLPTLLSFIYTNIPPIKKGTDSRIGLGFRLGPNADFQVLFELGPQQSTLPLGPDGGGTSKREIDKAAWKGPQKKSKNQLEALLLRQKIPSQTYNLEENNEYPYLDQDVVNHLKLLYKKQTQNFDTKRM
ncbi:hypothetical protein AAG570_010434, partial [Ranatra chinensis]